jgi:hypothetical protein
MNKYFLLAVICILLVIEIGCNKNSTEVDQTMGMLVVKLTDAPFPLDQIASANVTIDKIEIRKAGDESEERPFVILSEQQFNQDLKDLQNGVTAELVSLEVEAGVYDLVRLYVSEAEIVLIDETPFILKIPSGEQTGIKIFIEPSIQVEGGLTAELLLDFNLSRSFVVQGNPETPAGINGFIFKPVIRAVNVSTAGRITGTVTDKITTNPLEDAEVWVEKDAVAYAPTHSDVNGNYQLIGVLEGQYTLSAKMEGYDQVVIENVDVKASNETKVDIELTPQTP